MAEDIPSMNEVVSAPSSEASSLPSSTCSKVRSEPQQSSCTSSDVLSEILVLPKPKVAGFRQRRKALNSKDVCITEDEVLRTLIAQKEEKVENKKRMAAKRLERIEKKKAKELETLERKQQNDERKKKELKKEQQNKVKKESRKIVKKWANEKVQGRKNAKGKLIETMKKVHVAQLVKLKLSNGEKRGKKTTNMTVKRKVLKQKRVTQRRIIQNQRRTALKQRRIALMQRKIVLKNR